MVWNKIYRADIIKGIKFQKDLSFGEDAIFNIEVLMKTKELKHAPHILIDHYFDDENSLCRGQLTLEKLEDFIQALNELAEKQTDKNVRDWIKKRIEAHKTSPLFRRFGYGRKEIGKYDIVYCLKEAWTNEELRYSLRSVEENFKYRMVVFYGGCPGKLTPDRHVRVIQSQPTKWERVRNMLYLICDDDELTEDFWLSKSE